MLEFATPTLPPAPLLPRETRYRYECETCLNLYRNEDCAEAAQCPLCQRMVCQECAVRCDGCDKQHCKDCAPARSWDDGPGYPTCNPCAADANEAIDKCERCGRPRTDMDPLETTDPQTGYRAEEWICKPCQKANRRGDFNVKLDDATLPF